MEIEGMGGKNNMQEGGSGGVGAVGGGAEQPIINALADGKSVEKVAETAMKCAGGNPEKAVAMLESVSKEIGSMMGSAGAGLMKEISAAIDQIEGGQKSDKDKIDSVAGMNGMKPSFDISSDYSNFKTEGGDTVTLSSASRSPGVTTVNPADGMQGVSGDNVGINGSDVKKEQA